MRITALLASVAVVSSGCSSSNEPPSGTPLIRPITDASGLIGGPNAAGRIGDFLLDSGKARFVVQTAGSATGWGLYGGSLVDLDRSGGPGDDRLQEIFFQCDLRGFAPTTAEVVADGRDGKPAILRLRGVDRGIPLLDAIIPSTPSDLDVTIDMILAPGSATLEIAFDALDTRKTELRDVGCGVVLLHGDDYDFFTPGTGPIVSSENDWIASASPLARASYVLYRKGGPLNAIIAIDEVVPLSSATQGVFPGGRARDSLFLSVGERDVESALVEMRAVRGDAAARVAVEVPVRGPAERLRHVSVVVRDRDGPADAGYVTNAAVDATSGKARFSVLPGNYVADVFVGGRLVGTRELTAVAGTPLVAESVPVEDEGTLVIESVLTDAAGAELRPTGAHVFVKRGRDAAPNAAEVLKRYVLPSDQVVLPAGEYTVYVSRGPECELHRESITITAGERTMVRAKIAHVVDTTGWVTVDSHVHSTKSIDSSESLEQRVLGAVGEGLEILLSTEHDVVIDYGPTVRALGLERFVVTERGTEISPLYGHINAWPLPAESPEKYWDLKWFLYDEANTFVRMMDPHEIVPMARQRGATVVQINHPRDGKGVFDYIGLDPMTGDSRLPWPDPDVVEAINGKGEGGLSLVLRDLVNQWKRGKRVTAVGVSDAHGRGSEIGYARTAIRSASDDPATIDLPAVWTALREGKAVVMSGPFVTLTASGGGGAAAGIGEVAALGGRPVALDVTVQAPSWMTVSRVTVLADGAPMWTRELGPADQDPQNPAVRLRTTVTATPTRDAFYLVIAEGAGRNEPVMGSSAHTATNPVFVDVSGDGYVWGR